MLSPFIQFYKAAILEILKGGILGYILIICLIALPITVVMNLYVLALILFLVILFITIYLNYKNTK